MLYRLLATRDRHRALATWVVIAGVVGVGATCWSIWRDADAASAAGGAGRP